MTVTILDQGGGGADTDNQENIGNFVLTGRASVDYGDIAISKWQSTVTGLRVVHVDYES